MLRARVLQHLLSVQADDSRAGRLYIAGILRCPSRPSVISPATDCSHCFATRRLDLEVITALHGRAIATTRFRCRRCGTLGVPKILPAELLPVGGPVTLAFLWCNSCIWEIDQAQLDKPPWSGSHQRYRCPGCRGAVDWHIHGPVWLPIGNGTGSGDVGRP